MKPLVMKALIVGCTLLALALAFVGDNLAAARVRAETLARETARQSAYTQGFCDGARATISSVKMIGTNATVELENVLKEMKGPK